MSAAEIKCNYPEQLFFSIITCGFPVMAASLLQQMHLLNCMTVVIMHQLSVAMVLHYC